MVLPQNAEVIKDSQHFHKKNNFHLKLSLRINGLNYENKLIYNRLINFQKFSMVRAMGPVIKSKKKSTLNQNLYFLLP